MAAAPDVAWNLIAIVNWLAGDRAAVEVNSTSEPIHLKVVPGFGHEGALMFNQWTPAASLIRHLNPELAAGFVWAWDQQKRPGSQQHDNGFTHLTANQTDLLAQATPEVVRRSLASSWLPGFGATWRRDRATPWCISCGPAISSHGASSRLPSRLSPL